ncbi:MAG: hypothetical protein C0399_03340 [Syntrophus sp. (in: bacteria)]|nr:hypothetical protein [Syntrophus sp. (in: bacteria)]
MDMKKNGMFLVIISLFVITGLLMTGCGKKEDTFSISTPGGKVTMKTDGSSGQGAVQIETKDGKAVVVAGQPGGTITEAQLGVPVYPGATVKAIVSMQGAAGDGKGRTDMCTLVTPDNFEKVAAFYKSNLKNVKNSFVQGSGDQGIASFTVAGDNAITVNLGPGEKNKGTAIQVAKQTK